LNDNFKNENIGELSPGATDRRYLPKGGVRKHRDRIHKESKFADNYKNLSFKFSKPKKSRRKSTHLKCDACGRLFLGSEITVGIICPKCKKFSTASKVEA